MKQQRFVRIGITTACLFGLVVAAWAGTNDRFIEAELVANEPVLVDTASGLEWKKRHDASKTWMEALALCEGLSYAGKDDWRLPNKSELFGTVSYDRERPATDFPLAPAERFWTSTTFPSEPSRAWYVNFSDGGVRYELKGSRYYVRCVRGPAERD